MMKDEKIRKLRKLLAGLVNLSRDRLGESDLRMIQRILRQTETSQKPPETARLSVIGQDDPGTTVIGQGKSGRVLEAPADADRPGKIKPQTVQIDNGPKIPVESWEVSPAKFAEDPDPLNEAWARYSGVDHAEDPDFTVEAHICGGCGYVHEGLIPSGFRCEECGWKPFQECQNVPPKPSPPNVCKSCGCGFADWCPCCPACGGSK